MDKIHLIPINDDLDEAIRKFQNSLKPGEQIVSQQVVEGKLSIVTRETKVPRRNLLLEEIDARRK